ncbi:WD40 repeat-like protein [Suillus weaverae]|nr:WD40 repeat-like protein [Suillus weaverae]
MASSSTQPGAGENKSILTPVMTLEGHEPWKYPTQNGEAESVEYKSVSCISYFPDGKEMISGSDDKSIRRWDLREGNEIKEAREVCDGMHVHVGVSRDGRWVVTAVGGEVKVNEVKTGVVRTFHQGDDWIKCIDISADSTLLATANGWIDSEVRIWSLDTGELVASLLLFGHAYHCALRFSADSWKLAALSDLGRCLQVWDVQAQKLDAQKSNPSNHASLNLAVFWTTKNKSIVAPFSFTDDFPRAIYEFDTSTLKTVGAPFKHISPIESLALSSDCTLLASSSHRTIKLWAFESRQLLASFDVKSLFTLVLSPDSRQLAYTSRDDTKIYICNIPANVLASIEQPQPGVFLPFPSSTPHRSSLQSDATRPVRRKPVIIPVTSSIPRQPRPNDPHAFLRFLHKLLPFSSRTDAVRTDEPRNPLDFPATSPLLRPLIKPDENSRPTLAPLTSQSSAINTPATLKSSLLRLSTWWPLHTDHASPTIVDVPLAPGKLRYATAGAPGDDDDLIRDEDYVSPPPSPNPGSRPGIVNSGQHGSGRCCFCF